MHTPPMYVMRCIATHTETAALSYTRMSTGPGYIQIFVHAGQAVGLTHKRRRGRSHASACVSMHWHMRPMCILQVQGTGGHLATRMHARQAYTRERRTAQAPDLPMAVR